MLNIFYIKSDTDGTALCLHLSFFNQKCFALVMGLFYFTEGHVTENRLRTTVKYEYKNITLVYQVHLVIS